MGGRLADDGQQSVIVSRLNQTSNSGFPQMGIFDGRLHSENCGELYSSSACGDRYVEHRSIGTRRLKWARGGGGGSSAKEPGRHLRWMSSSDKVRPASNGKVFPSSAIPGS